MQPNKFQMAMQRVAKGLFGINFGTPGVETWESTQNWMRGNFAPAGSMDRPYKQHATIAIAIGTIAEDAASVPWEVYPTMRSEDDEPIESHPLMDVFSNPNRLMNGLQLWTGTYISHQLFGEAFWYYPELVIGRRNAPRNANAIVASVDDRIVLLDPRSVQHKISDDGYISWTLRNSAGQDIPLDAEKLTQFRRMNPYNAVRGLSKVAAIIAEAKGDYEAAQWNERFFGSNNGMASGLLIPSVGSNLTADQRSELMRTWNQKHGLTKRAIGLLPAGWSFQDLGVTQRDMDFRALREYSREQILAMFGLPPFYAGVLDKANYANAREQKDVYWNGTITRFLGDIQATINSDFIPKSGAGDIGLWPNWEIVKALTENLQEKVAVAKELFMMGFPKSAINKRLELGFDMSELDDADIGYLPYSLAPVSLINDPPEPVAPAPPPQSGDDAGDEPTEDDAAKSRKAIATDAQREARRALVWRAVSSRTRDIEDKMNKVTRSYFKSVNDEVVGALRGPKGWMMKQGKGEMTPETLHALIADEGEEYARKMKPLYTQAVKRGGEAVVLETSVAVSFNMLDPMVIAELGRLYNRSSLIEETVYRKLQKEIATSMAGHETLDELIARVENVTGASMSRSMSIARTESGAAYGGGRYHSMRQAGIKEQEWLSSRDPDVRDSHSAVDGERAPVSGLFSNGLRYPKDPTGMPEEVINCRCVALSVFEEN